MEKWIEIRKGGNFMEMAKKYGIDPLIARIIRNRDIIDEKEITEYLYGGKEALHNPHLLKDVDKMLQKLLQRALQRKRPCVSLVIMILMVSMQPIFY